ncbi:conserved hypothetical protein, partial [Ricinus communis]
PRPRRRQFPRQIAGHMGIVRQQPGIDIAGGGGDHRHRQRGQRLQHAGQQSPLPRTAQRDVDDVARGRQAVPPRRQPGRRRPHHRPQIRHIVRQRGGVIHRLARRQRRQEAR